MRSRAEAVTGVEVLDTSELASRDSWARSRTVLEQAKKAGTKRGASHRMEERCRKTSADRRRLSPL